MTAPDGSASTSAVLSSGTSAAFSRRQSNKGDDEVDLALPCRGGRNRPTRYRSTASPTAGHLKVDDVSLTTTGSTPSIDEERRVTLPLDGEQHRRRRAVRERDRPFVGIARSRCCRSRGSAKHHRPGRGSADRSGPACRCIPSTPAGSRRTSPTPQPHHQPELRVPVRIGAVRVVRAVDEQVGDLRVVVRAVGLTADGDRRRGPGATCRPARSRRGTAPSAR